MNRNISAIMVLAAFLGGLGVSRLIQPPRMRHKFYGEIIFCERDGKTDSNLVWRLRSLLRSGGFRPFSSGMPGPNADPIKLELEGLLPITVWSYDSQSYFDRDGDVAQLTFGKVTGEDLTYLELKMLPGGPKSGFDENEKLEGVPLVLDLRKDFLKALADKHTEKNR